MLRVTKDQLKALLDYYEMWGVEEMDFHAEHFQATLENFAPRVIKVEMGEPIGRCCLVGRKPDDKP